MIKRSVLTLMIYSSAYGLVHADTLLDVFNDALKNDPQYLSAVESNNITKEEEEIALANHWPTISLGASRSRTETSGTNEFTDISKTPPLVVTTSDSETESVNYFATLSIPIYKYENFINSSLADVKTSQAEADLKSARQELIIRIAKRYFAVLAAEDGVAFSRAEKQSIARQLDQTKQRFDVGLVAITDVHEAQARYDFSVAQGIDAENKLDNAKESLREVTGRYHEELAHLAKNTPLLEPKPADIETWTKRAMDKSLDLQSALHAVEITRKNINLARAPNHPTVDLSVSYNGVDTHTDGGDASATDNTSTTARINLNYVLYNGGGTRARIRQAERRLTQAQQNLEQVRRSVQRNARDAYLDVIAGISRVKALEQAVVSRQSAQRASEAGFEVGTKTTVDVLDSRRELFSAQNAYSQARYDFILDTLKLKQAVGELTVDDLEKVNSWME